MARHVDNFGATALFLLLAAFLLLFLLTLLLFLLLTLAFATLVRIHLG